MRLILDDSVEVLEEPTEDLIMEKIRASIHNDRFFSHLVADSEEIYSDPEDYLKKHLAHIQELRIVTQTRDEMIREGLAAASAYLKRATPLIAQLADRFYQNPKPDDWKQFGDLLGGIQWIDETLTLIFKAGDATLDMQSLRGLQGSVQEQVKGMDEALRSGDHVLTADILQYEIQPLFADLEKEMDRVILEAGNGES